MQASFDFNTVVHGSFDEVYGSFDRIVGSMANLTAYTGPSAGCKPRLISTHHSFDFNTPFFSSSPRQRRSSLFLIEYKAIVMKYMAFSIEL